MVTAAIHDHAARLRSFEIVVEVRDFALESGAATQDSRSGPASPANGPMDARTLEDTTLPPFSARITAEPPCRSIAVRRAHLKWDS